MTRAEEAAIKAYPIETRDNDGIVNDIGHPQWIRDYFIEGYEQAEKDLGWHSVEEYLPPIDEEVIVLTDDIHGKTVEGANRICFGHIVNKRYAKDYNGWNIPGVHHWMLMPKLPEE